MRGQDALVDDFVSSTLDDGQNPDMLSSSKRANSQSMSPDELKSILIDSEHICKDRVENMVKAANSLTRNYELAAFLKDEGISDPIKRGVLRRKNSNGLTALFWAIRNRAHSSVIRRMVEIGGEALVLQQNPLGENSLHYAAYCGAELDVFKILLESGGRKALLVKDKITNTPLHYACGWCEDTDTIKYLIEEGGKEGLLLENEDKHVPLVKLSIMGGSLRDVCRAVGGDAYIQRAALHKPKDLSMHDLIKLNMISEAERRLKGDKEELFQDGGTERRLNCLMVALWFYGNAAQSFRQELCDFIKHMARVGGRRLVTMKNSNGCNALHYAAFSDAPLEIIKVLFEAAGEDIIHEQNRWENTPLHDACLRGAPEDVLEYLVKNQRGTEALLTLNKDGNTPLDLLFQAEADCDSRIAAIQRAWYEKDKNFLLTLSDDLLTESLLWASRAVDATHVTSNKFIRTLLDHFFTGGRFGGVMMGDLYVQVIVVTVLSNLTSCNALYADVYTPGECENLKWGGIVLLICCLYLIAREAIQFSRRICFIIQKLPRYCTDCCDHMGHSFTY
uniref:Ion transport domain-containing protein n=1 Tax=Chaetoceros debilis TaxID=122233 RepID=A0A7S3QCL6_9STRA